jgi:hypothetical protein
VGPINGVKTAIHSIFRPSKAGVTEPSPKRGTAPLRSRGSPTKHTVRFLGVPARNPARAGTDHKASPSPARQPPPDTLHTAAQQPKPQNPPGPQARAGQLALLLIFACRILVLHGAAGAAAAGGLAWLLLRAVPYNLLRWGSDMTRPEKARGRLLLLFFVVPCRILYAGALGVQAGPALSV